MLHQGVTQTQGSSQYVTPRGRRNMRPITICYTRGSHNYQVHHSTLHQGVSQLTGSSQYVKPWGLTNTRLITLCYTKGSPKHEVHHSMLHQGVAQPRCLSQYVTPESTQTRGSSYYVTPWGYPNMRPITVCYTRGSP